MAEIRRSREERPWSRLCAGAVVLSIGVIIWLDHLHRIRAGEYLQWWPVALIVLGLAHIAERRWSSAAILIAIGAALLPPLRYVYLRELIGMWPLLISIAGVTLIVQSLRPAATHSSGAGTFRAISVMGGNGRTIGSSEFAGGDAIAVMGGCEIDLTNATLTRDAVIEVLAFWGGIGVKVPRTWRVETRVVGILGAAVNNTSNGSKAGPLLVVRGSAIMGGIEVRNPREERV